MYLSPMLLLALLALLPDCTHAHGRLMDPPARNSMWRLGFANPVNYNDNELYCGGRMTQWARNNGKCGVCGDPHHSKREHEAGGKYANGIITREYKQGDVIDVTVHITANHKGFFEFRICPVQDPKVEVTQECLDEHVLEKADGNGTKYFLNDGQSNQFFNVSLRLPDDLSCQQCVIQWKYRTGNTWDKDESGKFCVGCGPQEEFYNCADVTINSKSKAAQKSDGAKNEKPKVTKTDIQIKKEAIVFTNEGPETNTYNKNSKMSDYGKQKAKFVQDSSKYSSLSISARQPSMTKSVIQTEAPLKEEENKFTEINKVNDHSGNTNAGMRSGYLDEQSLVIAKPGQAPPTNPSMVPYKWQSGTSKSSSAEEIRKRFGYSIGTERNNGGYNNGGNRKKADVETVVFVSKEGKAVSNPRNVVSRQQDVIRVKDQSNGVEQPVAGQTEPRDANQQRVTLDLNEITRGLAPSQSAPEEMNFLKRWKMLRLRQLAAQQALNMSSGRVTTTAGVTQDSRMQQLRKNLQNMRENGRNRQESRSPFTPPTTYRVTELKQEENETRPETVQTSKFSPISFSKPSTLSSGLQKYLKKRLPSWLVTALRIKESATREQESANDAASKELPVSSTAASTVQAKVNSERKISPSSSSAQNVHRDANRSGKKTSQNNSKRASLKQDGNRKLERTLKSGEGYEASTSDDETKRYGSQRSHANKGHSTHDAIRPLNKQTRRLNSERSENSPSVQVTGDNDEKTTNEEEVNKNGKDDAESLVRYIITTLLAKRSREQNNGGNQAEEEEQSEDGILSKKDNSDHVLTHSSSHYPTQTPWFVPAVPEAMPNTGSYGSGLLSHTSDRHGYNAESSNSVRVDSKPYNGLILGTDYGYNQGYPSTARAHNGQAGRWESHSAHENHAAMNAYRASLRAFEDSQVQHDHQARPHSSGFAYPNNNNNYVSTFASGRQQQNGWDSSEDVGTENEFVQDPNHVWAMRAQKRQEYYQQQPQPQQESSQLVCEGLVTLGGGMDKWCTDNCNANFCPSTICVCKKQVLVSSHPFSSSYSTLNSRTPSVASWGSPRPVSDSRHVVRNSQSPYYAPASQSYVTSGQGTQRVDRRPQRKQSQRTPYLYPLLTTAFLDPVPTAPTFAAYSARSVRGSSQFMPRHMPGTRVGGSRQPQLYAQPESYMSKAVSPRTQSGQFYPQSQNMIGHRSVYDSNSNTIAESTLPLQMNWISGSKHASNDDYDVTSGRRSPSLNAARGAYLPLNLRDEVTDANLRIQEQNYINNQYTVPSGTDEMTDEQPARLNCRAVGAYRGLDHFDEWCETTCYTSMCPLLMCECDS
ncbi:unnamed protein product [Lymnaea stagnalis]|uniref:Chitin-binding type-4 domain-containing protein n=1 Tax=Lymnaea stagnalis TaxID=6523 RepID=A0AAV2HDT3_LYMST